MIILSNSLITNIPMEKNRKPDQFYIDQYDRHTIELLKEVEVKAMADRAAMPDQGSEQANIMVQNFIGVAFQTKAIQRARLREEKIRERIAEDEQLDRLLDMNPVPRNITCNTCHSQMQYSLPFFDHHNVPLLFIFTCPNEHFPRKLVYPDGREHIIPKKTCKKCGMELSRTSETRNNILYTTTACTLCGTKEVSELDLHIDDTPPHPISEEDRKYYCLSFLGQKTIFEELESLANFFESVELQRAQKEEREELEVEKLEKLTIPILESRLQEVLNKKGFIKLSFDRPEMKRHTIITFNFQDPSDRDEPKSIKAATAAITNELFPTNWRLSGKIDYRLGYLTGTLKAFETDEDLLKLAKEIKKLIK